MLCVFCHHIYIYTYIHTYYVVLHHAKPCHTMSNAQVDGLQQVAKVDGLHPVPHHVCVCVLICVMICVLICVMMCTDLCIDLCIDLCTDMCTGMYIDMCTDMC